ncbi:MAG: acyltransferase [Alphaproteobacteria bacterium]|nr:acyltransferase [Alphaproteobacteria bacterium]MCB9974465.1 acyltransferase [Rhodospirillales bacterium]
MPHPETPKLVIGNRYREIDGLRALAAFLVIWGHSGEMAGAISTSSGLTDYYTNIARLGSSGVTLFFIISGFLITGILIDTKDQPRRFKNFYIRRTLRIFPLYYLGIFFIFILMLFFRQSGGDYNLASVYIYHILFISNWVPFFDLDNFATSYADLAWFAHLWSLAVEQQFYIVWPALFFFMFRKTDQRQLLLILVGLIIFSTLLRVYFTYSFYWLPAYIGTLTRMDALFMGAALAVMLSYEPETLKKINLASRAIVPFLMVVLVLVFIVTAGKSAFLINIPLSIVPLTACLYFFLVNAMIMPGRDNRLRKSLNNPVVQHAGTISYGLYIFSAPVQIALGNILILYGSKDFWFNHAVMFFPGLAITYLMATLSYTFMEKPIMRLKKIWAPYKH